MATKYPLEERQLGEKSDCSIIGEKLLRMWTKENMKLQIYRVKTAGTNRLKEEQESEIVTSGNANIVRSEILFARQMQL